MAVSDKELKRLLRDAFGHGQGKAARESAMHALDMAVGDIARELLAARKVVRAAKLEVDGWPQDMPKLLAAYDKARRGKP